MMQVYGVIWVKRPNLNLKTQPKQLLGSLPLDIALHAQPLLVMPPNLGKATKSIVTGILALYHSGIMSFWHYVILALCHSGIM